MKFYKGGGPTQLANIFKRVMMVTCFPFGLFKNNVRSFQWSLRLRMMNAYKEVKGQKPWVMQVKMPEAVQRYQNRNVKFHS